MDRNRIMKRSIRTILLNILYFSFILILLETFITRILVGYAKESWNITEFLINYQGGFVRRGLSGEILLKLHHYLGLDPYLLIIFICTLAFIILIIFFLRSFIKGGYTIFLLPFVFFLGGPIISDFWVRKDIIIILIFILTIYFAIKKSSKFLVLANISFILGLLIHESIGFFLFPILILILFEKNQNLNTIKSSVKVFLLLIIQISPAIITFLCTLYYKGSAFISIQIWNSWKTISFPIQSVDNSVVPAAINGISWSLQKGLSTTVDTLNNFQDGIYAPLAWILILSAIYYILTNTDKLNFKILNYRPSNNFSKTNLSNILIFQLLAIVPLFILGWDYGRWVFYWVTSSFALIILIPEEKLVAIFPKFVSKISIRLNTFLDSILSKSKGFLLLLLFTIGVPSYSWTLLRFTNSSFAIIILKYISKILKYIVNLI